MKKIIILLILIISCGCKNDNNELDDIIAKNNYVIIDVRTKEEYNSGHVIDAINIPYDEIDETTNIDKNKTVLVYCKSGNRSKTAFNALKDLGYDVIDLGAYNSINLEKE